ncbi:MAG TPA: hypothetical protein HA362_05400 [Nanoarchaeota archaeon]|nr:hypothetical protein [Nanoarchaeota archaeon]
MKIVVISNMNSGKNLRDKLRVYRMEKFVGDRGQVYATASVDELGDIVSCLYKMYQAERFGVVLDGGDGLSCQYVKHSNRYWPKGIPQPAVALLRGGTMNFLPKECGIKSNKKYMKAILESKEEDLFYQDIDFMKITDNNKVESYGFSFGIGAPVTLLKEWNKHKKLKALQVGFILARLLASKMLGVSKIWRQKYYDLFNQKQHIHAYAGTNGSTIEWDADFLGIMAQSIKSIGLPYSKMFYRAQQSAGNFHVLGTSADLIELMPYLPAMYLGKKVPGMDADTQTNYFCAVSEREMEYTVNGELEYFVENEAKTYLANQITAEHGLTLKIIKAAP